MKSTPTIALIGRPNVGKSSLFNRLTHSRQAITDATAGTTRDANRALVSWGGHNLWLTDLAGLEAAEDEIGAQAQARIAAAAAQADLLIVVADASVDPTKEDMAAAKLAHKSGKPVVLALNKIDAAHDVQGVVGEYRRLGMATIIPVSALHGRGTGDLLEHLAAQLPAAKAPAPDDRLHLALLGRPNVGKSSLLNRLCGTDHAIVSGTAGTTRDAVWGEVTDHGRRIAITDTAGLRRRGKIERGVEKFSVLRTHAAIAQADICVVVLDATELGTAGDQHIAGLVAEAGKGLILAVNKWDVAAKTEHTQAELARRLQHDFQFAWWAPLVFVSAETGLHVPQILALAREIDARRCTAIATPKLNRLLQNLLAQQPPAGTKGKRPSLKYITQTGTQPPAFTLFGSNAESVHFSYRRFLENGLRAEFDLTGTPIRLIFQAKEPKP